MIKVKNISKKYGSFEAVKEVSFTAEQGDILAFLGPNGAGKSTTMKILSGYISPSSGEAYIDGISVREKSLAIRKIIGYLPESAPSYKDMSVTEFLNFIGETRGFFRKELQEKVENVMEKTSLFEVGRQTIDTLSKGYRQRVGFAQALIHDPPVLILDEPTDGLDPNQKHEMRQLIKNMGKEKVIILSTHILEEMEAICNRAVIINQGLVVADSSPEELIKRSKYHNALRIRFETKPTESFFSEISQWKGVKGVECKINDKKTVLILTCGRENIIIGKMIEWLQQSDLQIQDIEREYGRIDEVFRSLTQ